MCIVAVHAYCANISCVELDDWIWVVIFSRNSKCFAPMDDERPFFDLHISLLMIFVIYAVYKLVLKLQFIVKINALLSTYLVIYNT